MRRISSLLLPAFLALASPAVPAAAPDSASAKRILVERTEVPRVDGSAIELLVSRPDTPERVPILLVVEGSVCIPSTASGVTRRLEPPARGLVDVPFARVVVEKPGVGELAEEDGDIRIGPDHRCSEEFRRNYSIERRVLDHLRALQHLRRRSSWWTGELYVWGFSDGGTIGARVAGLAPETKRAVLGGFGGGIPFTELWEDHLLCAEPNPDRERCRAELREQFDRMRRNPTGEESWMGDSNTWKVWADRLDAVPARALFDAGFPVLLWHGSEDRSVPVESARRAVELLRRPGGPAVTYWEIPGMGHGLGGLDEGPRDELLGAMLEWLLVGPEGVERPGMSR